jgi:SAM-dependent methyltransferase
MSVVLQINELKFRDPVIRPLFERLEVNAATLPCPVCDRSDALTVVSCSDNGTETSLCIRCRHFYFSKRPTPAWFETFYQTEWVKGRTHGKDDAPLRTRIRSKVRALLGRASRSSVMRHADFCEHYVRGCGNVLEVGAGSGRYLLPFAKRGLKCYAVEPAPNSAAACRAQGIEVLDSFIENADESNYPSIDLLFSNHSVEHHFDPNHFFGFARRLLRPGKHVCVSVPNHDALFLPTECLFVLHPHSFTEQSLDRILRKHGFRTVAKAVDDQLRFMAERVDDNSAPYGEPTQPKTVSPTQAVQTATTYQSRMLRSLQLPDDPSDYAGSYLCSFQTTAEPYRPGFGRHTVAVRRLRNGEPPSDALQTGPYLRSFLFDIRPGTRTDSAIEFQGNHGRVAPIFVK